MPCSRNSTIFMISLGAISCAVVFFLVAWLTAYDSSALCLNVGFSRWSSACDRRASVLDALREKWEGAVFRHDAEQRLGKLLADRVLDDMFVSSADIAESVIPSEYFARPAAEWGYKAKFSKRAVCNPGPFLRDRGVITFHTNNRDRVLGFFDLERLGWRNLFPAVVAAYEPPFNVCTPPIFFDDSVMPEGMSSPLHFFPGVDFGSEHDCDILPILMRALVPQGSGGIAVDVGASEGMCTLLLLAHGHTVYSYEENEFFANWREMSIKANAGFHSRTHLRRGLDTKQGITLDREFLDSAGAPQHIDLVKVDVDEFTPSVLDGMQRLLRGGHVRALQLELLGTEMEGGNEEKKHLLDSFAAQAYYVFALTVKRPHGASYPSVFHADDASDNPDCKKLLGPEFDPDPENVRRGGEKGSNYRYGEGAVEAVKAMHVASPSLLDASDAKTLAIVACYSQYLVTRDKELLRALGVPRTEH